MSRHASGEGLKWSIALIVVGALAFNCDRAMAGPYRGIVEGSVFELVDDSLAQLLSAGDEFRFSYVFDSTAQDQRPGFADVGLYELLSAEVTIGSFTASSGPGEEGTILVVEGVPDRYEVIWYFTAELAGYAEFGVGFSLWSGSTDVFTDDELPTYVDLAFLEPQVYGVWSSDPALLLTGELDSHTFEVIPEPGTIGFLALGAIALLRRKRHRPSLTTVVRTRM